jgi:dTDP-4-dehydrorhamnose 3,5-epimerase-like enzyme
MANKKYSIINFSDERGYLLPIELKTVGFEPKRIFIVNNVPLGLIRGNHSHYKTEQLIICTNGSVNVFLDDGINKEIVLLKKSEAILAPKLVWDSQEFLDDNSEILVICSTEYDATDYILDYNEFISIVKK